MKRFALCCVVVASGCVSQGTYDALKKDQADTQQSLAASNATLEQQKQQLADNQRQLAADKAQLQALQAALDEEKAKEAQLDQQLKQAQDEMARNMKDRASLKASVDEMKLALAAEQQRKAQAEARIAEYKDLLGRFKSLIDAGKLKVKLSDGRMVVVLATDVLFGSGSATLSKAGKSEIAEVAGLLASIPKRTFQVEGHTDNVPISTAAYPSNWELASARALTVVKAMVDAGMPAERISAAAFGETHPAVSNDTPEGRAQNRRIEIIVVPDLSTLPGFDELQKATNP